MDSKAFKKVLKDIKFPGGGSAIVNPDRGYAKFEKRHGYAGASAIRRVREAAFERGFKRLDSSASSDATGDQVNRGEVLVLGDVTLTFRAFYGQTSWENSFSIDVRGTVEL